MATLAMGALNCSKVFAALASCCLPPLDALVSGSVGDLRQKAALVTWGCGSHEQRKQKVSGEDVLKMYIIEY